MPIGAGCACGASGSSINDNCCSLINRGLRNVLRLMGSSFPTGAAQGAGAGTQRHARGTAACVPQLGAAAHGYAAAKRGRARQGRGSMQRQATAGAFGRGEQQRCANCAGWAPEHALAPPLLRSRALSCERFVMIQHEEVWVVEGALAPLSLFPAPSTALCCGQHGLGARSTTNTAARHTPKQAHNVKAVAPSGK